MEQHGIVASATSARRGLPALRPLLLLGGFVLAWWLLMTGAAQADDGHTNPSRDLGTAVKAVTGKAPAPAQAAKPQPQPRERPVQKSVRAVVKPVVTPVTTSVPATVREAVRTVEATPVTPVVRSVDAVVRETRKQLQPTTGSLRTEVRNVLERTSKLPLDLPRIPDLDEPVVDATSDTSVGHTSNDAASNDAARTADSVEQASSAATASAAVPAELAALVEQAGATETSDREAVVQSSSDHPLDGLPGSGVLTQNGVSSAGSAGPGSGHAPCAVLGSGAHLDAPGALTTRPTDSDRRPVGPAYPPSCSPD